MQGRARDQVDVKGQLSYLPPTKAPPPQVDKPTTLQPRGGSYLPRWLQPWLGVYEG